MKITKLIHSFFSHLKSLFLSGLFTLLPIIFTVFTITFTYSFIAQKLEPLRRMQPLYLQKIPGFEFVTIVLCILGLGFLLKLVFVTPMVHWFEKIIKKIPIVRSIYTSSKILVNFFSAPDSKEKKRKVVLIEFPRPGLFNIAFLLEPATDNFQKLIPAEKIRPNSTYYKIFMPNSPNPTSGYFLILPESEITHTNLTFDEAIKAVVSGGLVTPESLK